MCTFYPAGFRLETRWRTGDHSGTVYRQIMYMNTYVHVHKQHGTRNNLNIKPARCLSYKAFKVVLETKNITDQKIMQQYNYMEMGPESPSLSASCKVAHFSLMHSVYEDRYRFALDLGVYKKMCTTKH